MQIFKSSFVLMFWTLLSRITGFVRDALMANYLGSGMVSDAIFAASKIPNSFRRLLAEGSLSSVFVPMFSKDVAQHDMESAKKFTNNIFTILLITLLLITLTCQVFMPEIIAFVSPGFLDLPQKFELTVLLARINFLFLVAICLTSLCGGVMNSLGKFAHFAATPVVLNAMVIFALSVSCNATEEKVAYFVSYATVAAGIVQLVWLMCACWKSGIKVRPCIPYFNAKTADFMKKMLHGLIASGIYQINIFVDTIFASMFAGGVSYLYYTDRINQLPLTIIGGTLGVALLPIASRYIKLQEMEKLMQVQKQSILFAFFASFICISTICAFGSLIVEFIYQHGEFSTQDTKVVTKMLLILSFALLFSVFSKIYNAFLFSAGETKIPMVNGVICTTINILLNALFYKSLGVYCVVYATLVSSIFSGILPIIKLYRMSMIHFDRDILVKIIKLCLCVVIVYLLQSCMAKFILRLENLKFLALFCALGLGAVIYICLTFAFRVYRLAEIISLFKKNGNIQGN